MNILKKWDLWYWLLGIILFLVLFYNAAGSGDMGMAGLIILPVVGTVIIFCLALVYIILKLIQTIVRRKKAQQETISYMIMLIATILLSCYGVWAIF